MLVTKISAPSSLSLAVAFTAGAAAIGALSCALWLYLFGLDVLAWGAAGAFVVMIFFVLFSATLCGTGFGITLHGMRSRARNLTSTRPRLAASAFGAAAAAAGLGIQLVSPFSLLLGLSVFAGVGAAAAALYARLYTDRAANDAC